MYASPLLLRLACGLRAQNTSLACRPAHSLFWPLSSGHGTYGSPATRGGHVSRLPCPLPPGTQRWPLTTSLPTAPGTQEWPLTALPSSTAPSPAPRPDRGQTLRRLRIRWRGGDTCRQRGAGRRGGPASQTGAWTRRGLAVKTANAVPFGHTSPRKAHPDLKQPRLYQSQLGDAHPTRGPGGQRRARMLVVLSQSLRAAAPRRCGAGTAMNEGAHTVGLHVLRTYIH